MANKIVLLDTSVLIDYFRKADKSKTHFYQLASRFDNFVISAISEFEIRSGINEQQQDFWTTLLNNVPVIPFDSGSARIAVEINGDLKKSRKQIDIADLFIAASAIASDFPFATLNKKHFSRIAKLKLID